MLEENALTGLMLLTAPLGNRFSIYYIIISVTTHMTL